MLGHHDGPVERRSAVENHLLGGTLSRRATLTLATLPLVLMAFAVVAALRAPAEYIALTAEDGFVEWLQVVALAVAGVAFLLAARRGWRSGHRLVPIVHLLMSLGALVVAGEEISWGQRIFGWSTPPLFGEINSQAETNLHNVVALESAMKVAMLGAGAYGTILPFIARSRWAPSWMRSSMLVPPIALVSFFLVPLAHWSARILFDPDRPMGRLSEAAELALFAGGALFALHCLRELATEKDHMPESAMAARAALGSRRA